MLLRVLDPLTLAPTGVDLRFTSVQDDISAKEASIVVNSYITAQQQKGVGNYWISILLIVFTLNRLSYILFVVLLSVLFLKKYQKRGSRVRHSVLKVDNIAFSHPVRCKLRLHCARPYAVNVVDLQSKFKSCLATSFSRFTPRHSQLVAMLGAARTRCAQTSCHLFPIIARLLAVPPNAAL